MPISWAASIRKSEPSSPPNDAIFHFQRFYDSTSLTEANQNFLSLLNTLKMESETFHNFFPHLKSRLKEYLPYKYQGIWDCIASKSDMEVYGGGIASAYNVLVVGAGPCGLRSAIETQLLGAKTVIIEARKDFSRNNVLKLWGFVIEDLKQLGFKNFYGQFCTGNINHISIKTLQLGLSKLCLMMGVKIISPVTFQGLQHPTDNEKYWSGKFSPDDKDLNNFSFDMIIMASGKNVPLDGFNHQAMNTKLSIAVTGNFVNNKTQDEQAVEEISGLSKQYNQAFFSSIEKEKGIALENIVYYKGETHYFVMTASRKSLLKRGVLIENSSNRKSLMASTNVDNDKLYSFVIDAVEYSTNYLSSKLPTIDFAKNQNGSPDVAIFDFTNLYYANNSCRVKIEKGCKLIMAVVGDSLLEPFWPDGTGCGRGFLSSMNAAWMLRRYAEGMKTTEILAEREYIYRQLRQTNDDPADVLRNEYKLYTLNPKTRYKNIPHTLDVNVGKNLYEKYVSPTIDPGSIITPQSHAPQPNSRQKVLKKISDAIRFPSKINRSMKRSYSRYQRGYDDNNQGPQNSDGASRPKRRKTTLLHRLTVSSGSSSIFRKRTQSASRHQSRNRDVKIPDVPKRSPGPRHKKPKLLRENSIQLTTREGVEIEVMSYCDDGVASKNGSIEGVLIGENISNGPTLMKGMNDDGSPRRPRRRHEAQESQSDYLTDVEVNISCHGDYESMTNIDKLVSTPDEYLCNSVSQDEKDRNVWSPTRPRRRHEIEQHPDDEGCYEFCNEGCYEYCNEEVEKLRNSLETININSKPPGPMNRSKASLSSKKVNGRKSIRKSIKLSKKKCKLM